MAPVSRNSELMIAIASRMPVGECNCISSITLEGERHLLTLNINETSQNLSIAKCSKVLSFLSRMLKFSQVTFEERFIIKIGLPPYLFSGRPFSPSGPF